MEQQNKKEVIDYFKRKKIEIERKIILLSNEIKRLKKESIGMDMWIVSIEKDFNFNGD